MRTKLLLLLSLILASLTGSLHTGAQTPADTIFNPPVLYTAMPRIYTIADIEVEGADNYDDYIILGYAGLHPGDRVGIPGDDITNAVKRLMRQTLFAQARFELTKTLGDSAWLKLVLLTQPRIT